MVLDTLRLLVEEVFPSARQGAREIAMALRDSVPRDQNALLFIICDNVILRVSQASAQNRSAGGAVLCPRSTRR